MAKLIFLISEDGFQDYEFKIPYQLLKNNTHKIDIVSLNKKECTGKFSLKVNPDKSIEEINEKDYDGIIIAGGPGAKTLKRKPVFELIKKFEHNQKLIAAICISPALLLAPAGVLKNKKATCFQTKDKTSKNEIIKHGGIFVNENVVKDKNIITANGPNASKNFAMEILKFIKENISDQS